MLLQQAIFLFLFSCLGPAQAPDSILAEGVRLLEEGRTTLEEKPLTDAKNYFTQLAQTSKNPAHFYQLARADSYLMESYAARHESKRAEQALEDAIAAAQHCIGLDDKSAEAHSLLADLYGRKISLGGFLAGPRFGPKIVAENKKALDLAPNDALVYASLGRQYLYAPKMFGGDVGRAIDNFLKATQLDPSSDENFVWLAIAYRKNGDTPHAEKALRQAVQLNPRSAFAKATAAGSSR
jgi:tetratricopeptide (TPR) repeat protein